MVDFQILLFINQNYKQSVLGNTMFSTLYLMFHVLIIRIYNKDRQCCVCGMSFPLAMEPLICLLVLTVGYCVTATEGNNSSSCLFWNDQRECMCENLLHGAVICHNDQTYLRVDYGMDVWQDTTVIALNRYAYHNLTAIPTHLKVYTQISAVLKQDLNQLMCDRNNRKGFLCSKCVPNYGPSAYSSKCHECDRSIASAIALYLTMKILPAALLFFLVVMFRINLTEGPMLGYIIYCQMPVIAKRELEPFYNAIVTHLNVYSADIFLFISGIWNLDFLDITGLISPFCISPRLRDMDVLLLNFLPVLIPLFLVIVTYVVTTLHARDFKLFVYCWKPFHFCFVRIHKNYDISDSVVHGFASLMFLSFISVNYNAYRILLSINVYRANSTHPLLANVLYNHPGTRLFTLKYIYYPITVVVLLFFLGVLPSLLLLLYPIRLFRERLQRYCSQRFIVRLNTFVETFLGSFKDGYHGTHNLRMVPGILCCFILLLTVFSSLSFGNWFTNFIIPLFSLCFASLSVVSAYVRPCKSSIANFSLAFHFMMMAAVTSLITLWMQDFDIKTTVIVFLFAILIPTPHVLVFIWLCYKLEKKLHLLHRFMLYFNCWCGRAIFTKLKSFHFNSPPLPDRLVNSHEYRELI